MRSGAEYRRLRPASNSKWKYGRSRTQKALTIPVRDGLRALPTHPGAIAQSGGRRRAGGETRRSSPPLERRPRPPPCGLAAARSRTGCSTATPSFQTLRLRAVRQHDGVGALPPTPVPAPLVARPSIEHTSHYLNCTTASRITGGASRKDLLRELSDAENVPGRSAQAEPFPALRHDHTHVPARRPGDQGPIRGDGEQHLTRPSPTLCTGHGACRAGSTVRVRRFRGQTPGRAGASFAASGPLVLDLRQTVVDRPGPVTASAGVPAGDPRLQMPNHRAVVAPGRLGHGTVTETSSHGRSMN